MLLIQFKLRCQSVITLFLVIIPMPIFSWLFGNLFSSSEQNDQVTIATFVSKSSSEWTALELGCDVSKCNYNIDPDISNAVSPTEREPTEPMCSCPTVPTPSCEVSTKVEEEDTEGMSKEEISTDRMSIERMSTEKH